MPSPNNSAVIACAGSGKTTRLVKAALASSGKRIAILTYTNNNARVIKTKFAEWNSGVPRNVDIITWFSFLMRECARPYQKALYSDNRIESFRFVNQQSTKFVKERDTKRYYFAQGDLLYSDKASRFVLECETKSKAAVTKRLRDIYTDIFIDEFQDLAGWDLEIIEMLLRCDVGVQIVGDPRQNLYSTNSASKNRQYQGINILKLLRKWEKQGLCSLDFMNTSRRCNGYICGFANSLWPGMEPMTPFDNITTGHDGIFLVPERLVPQYIAQFRPQILRHSIRSKFDDLSALNFGQAKGLEWPRVLIVPTKPIRDYLRTGDLNQVYDGRDRLHVAATRAKHSVAFVYDGAAQVVSTAWKP